MVFGAPTKTRSQRPLLPASMVSSVGALFRSGSRVPRVPRSCCSRLPPKASRAAPGVVEIAGSHNPKAPSIQLIPTLGPKVYKYDLFWAIWSPRVSRLLTCDPYKAVFLARHDGCSSTGARRRSTLCWAVRGS